MQNTVVKWKAVSVRIARHKSAWMLATLAGSVFVARPALANPSVLMIYPSTEFTPRRVIRVNSDLYTRSFQTTTFGIGGLSYGFGSGQRRALGRSEIGLDYVAAAPFANVSFGNRTRFNAKTLLYDNPQSGVRVVTGVWGVGGIGNTASSSAFPPNVAYVLGSKRTKLGRIQVGLAQALARRAVLTTPAGKSDRTFLQLGFEREISRAIRFRMDFYSGKSSISAFVPGILIVLSEQAAIRLGYIRYNDSSIQPSREQFIIAFDLLAEKPFDDADDAFAEIGAPTGSALASATPVATP